MSIFSRKSFGGGFMDIIRCDEPNYLIWKWHPTGSDAGKNRRENAIRWGSSLRVKDGEVAVFVYNQKNGMFQDFIEGPFDETIKTANFPVLSRIIGLAYDGGTPFQAEVYFINLARINQVKFGIPYFDVYDPRFADFGVPVAVRGTISFKISDYREFVKLHRLSSFTLDDFQKQIRDAVTRYVKDSVANAPAAHDIPVVQIESKTAQINDAVEYDLSLRLKESFGVETSGVDIGAIEIDKSSSGYIHLLAVTRDVNEATIKARTAANIKDYEESLRIQREEGQYAMHKQTQTSNLTAFQTEAQTQIGIAGAEALGKMGANGAGNVDLGGGGGFNPAAMMAGMAIGGAVGQNVAGAVSGIMSGMNQSCLPGSVPPPIPAIAYHVAINGQAAGPFNVETLKQMAATGQVTGDSLVWKQGMADWAQLNTISALADICSCIPPVIKE